MYILFDPVHTRQNLLPLTYTRPIADCRVGILTIREKWERYLGAITYTLSDPYLAGKFLSYNGADTCTYINGSVIPSEELFAVIKGLKDEQALKDDNTLIAFRTKYEDTVISSLSEVKYEDAFTKISNLHDIFKRNGAEIKSDFANITKGRKSQVLSDTNRVLGDLSMIFLEEGASVECAIINTHGGPVYIDRYAEIMEGCMIRGPFALGAHASLKMGAKIYGDTTVGPYCKVGGEVSNSVFFAYSNKGHDGFVGNSVIGEWCNLGADTNTSNLKNNYGNVDVWNYREEKYLSSGLQFHGLVMGDHSKSSINTMFNTGTVVGVAANVFDSGFPDKFVPSFTWGGASGMETFRFDKAIEVATRMMERRGLALTLADIHILQVVFDLDSKYRQ